MREIPLRPGVVALVDDEDYEAVIAAGPWQAVWDKVFYYAVKTVRTETGRTALYLHTFLTGYEQTDHKNGNSLDDQRSNLRPATKNQQMQNRGTPSNNTSGYKGVYWRSDCKKWRVVCAADGVRHNMGSFVDLEEAARAYDKAAILYHGEFARTNFPLSDYNVLV